jgi:hypothetical protein
MSNAITPIGGTTTIAATTSVTVANVATNTNTFHFTNGSTTEAAIVGVFSTYAAAAAATIASAVVVLPASGTATIRGDFGTTASTSEVYVAAIAGTLSATVYATPVGQ